MKKYEERVTPPVPQKVENVFVEAVCDICGKVSKIDDYDGIDWSDDIDGYLKKFVTIKKETKHSYPEGGDCEEEYFEICDECFDNKVVPFLESLGAKKYLKEYDW